MCARGGGRCVCKGGEHLVGREVCVLKGGEGGVCARGGIL